MTPVEIIATAFLAVSFLKIIIVMLDKRSWRDFVVRFYKDKDILVMLFFVLTFIILYYLLEELSIVQVFASLALFSLFIGLSFLIFDIDVVKITDKFCSSETTALQVFYIVFWLSILIRVAYELFFS